MFEFFREGVLSNFLGTGVLFIFIFVLLEDGDGLLSTLMLGLLAAGDLGGAISRNGMI